MRKKLITASSATVAVSLLVFFLSACGVGNTSKSTQASTPASMAAIQTVAVSPDALSKYDPPISLMIGGRSTSTEAYVQGDSAENNPWTREFKSALGINVGYAWRVDDSQYDTKVNVVIASGTIPDMMRVTLKQYNMLVDAGLAADFTDILPKYTTQLSRSILTADEKAWSAANSSGKIYGIPNNNSTVPNALQEVYIRKDWMQSLNLQAPKNMDNMVKIAEAFTTQDPDKNGKADTFGLALSKDFIPYVNTTSSGNTTSSLGFFNGYRAYPGAWLPDSSGKLVYGSIQPPVKAALKVLQKMYAEGAMDKEFAVKDTSKFNEALVSGKAGIFFGPFWAAAWPLQDLRTANPKADWNYYPVLSVDAKPALPQVNVPLDGFWVVRKDYKYPEAVVKMFNLVADHYFSDDLSKNWFVTVDNLDKYTSKGIGVFDYSIMYQEPFDVDLRGYLDTVKGLKAKSGKSITYGASVQVYDQAQKFADTGDNSVWNYYAMFSENGSMKVIVDYINSKTMMYNSFYGIPGPVMTERGSTLTKMEVEEFTKIIMGSVPIDDFDKFVKQWQSTGGDDLTKEINDWYVKNK